MLQVGMGRSLPYEGMSSILARGQLVTLLPLSPLFSTTFRSLHRLVLTPHVPHISPLLLIGAKRGTLGVEPSLRKGLGGGVRPYSFFFFF